MEAKGSGFLKVTGILMIIGGALGLLLSIVTFVGIAALEVASDGLLTSSLLYVAAVISLLGAIVELTAGIVGVKNCKNPEKAGTCMVWGGLVIAISLISSILTVVAGSPFPTTTFLIGLILPGLYIFGAVKNKAA